MEMPRNKRIFLYAPDGVGVRNYLFSNLISVLAANNNVGLFHTLPDFLIVEIQQRHNHKIIELQLPKFSERKLERSLRDLCLLSRLLYNGRIRKNHRIWKSFLLLKKRTFFWKIYYSVLIIIARLVSINQKWVQSMDDFLNWMYTFYNPSARRIEELLKLAKPDVILCTHQRVPQAALMAAVARKMNIPFVTAIFSWDNLPKSRIAPKADKYIVWSSFMKNEMKTYYPLIKSNDVVITGTPQFECYHNESYYLLKEDFLNEWALPNNKKLVLLSGNDMASPNDHYYFEDIAEEILKLPEEKRPHLVLRRAPVDASGRFDGFAQKYASILTSIDPIWTTAKEEKDGFGSLPKMADVALLTNLCLHCDLVVNIGSTMGLDFAHFNKPAVYINYPKPYNTDWYDIEFIYGLEHFRTLDGLDAVLWIKSKNDILPVIQAALETPFAVATQRKEWKRKLTDDIPNASENIANLLLQMASKHE